MIRRIAPRPTRRWAIVVSHSGHVRRIITGAPLRRDDIARIVAARRRPGPAAAGESAGSGAPTSLHQDAAPAPVGDLQRPAQRLVRANGDLLAFAADADRDAGGAAWRRRRDAAWSDGTGDEDRQTHG